MNFLKIFEGLISVVIKVLTFFKAQKVQKEIKADEVKIKKNAEEVKKVEATIVDAKKDIAKVDTATEKKVEQINNTNSMDDLSKEYDNAK